MHLLLGRRGMRRAAAAVVAGLALAGTTATAQDYKYWKDGPHVGFATGGDVRNEDFAYGWQATWQPSDYFALDLSITRQNDEIQGGLDELTLPAEFNIEMQIYAFALTGRLVWQPLERLRLYGGGGAGFYIMKTDAEEIRVISASRAAPYQELFLDNLNVDVENSFGLHAAAGLEIVLSDRWELFAEYRHVSLQADADLEVTERFLPSPSAAPAWRTTIIPDTLSYDHGLARVGVNYSF